ncbi:M15 family metallopeptidase [Streptomyces sp. NPDC008122]|uniref:M15 family metallopeptidase n=1 Tax=Streptomyces sp. NPDC008122 TaxID=3364810 RepID=UPI0036E2A16B
MNGHRREDEKCCPLNAPGLSDRARRNRDLLARTMGDAGFINYPAEWWHWSYGDRYWALITKADSAIYGPA